MASKIIPSIFETQYQKQYAINLLKYPTVFIFCPKIIKKTELFSLSDILRQNKIKVHLINTKLMTQLLKNNKFGFLRPFIKGPITIGYSVRNITDSGWILQLIKKTSTELMFVCVLQHNKLITFDKLVAVEIAMNQIINYLN